MPLFSKIQSCRKAGGMEDINCICVYAMSAELEERVGVINDVIVLALSADTAGSWRCRRGVAVRQRPVSHGRCRHRGAGLRGAEHGEARTDPVQRVVRLRRTDSHGEDHQSRRTRCQGPQRHVRPVRQDLAAA